MGWFGPIAISTLYYASLMQQKRGDPMIWYVASLAICASVVAHGVSGVPLSELLGRVTGGRPAAGQGENPGHPG